MGYNITLLPEVEQELSQAGLFYKEVSSELSDDLFDNFQLAISEIADNPNLYPLSRKEYRKLSLKRFPFKIIFRIAGDKIVIVALAHHKRKPYYWKNR